MSSEDTPRRPAIRLLLSDVDGTLITPDKRLTEAAIAAAQALHAAGIAWPSPAAARRAAWRC